MYPAEFLNALATFSGACLVFAFGYLVGAAGKARAARRAADKAWRMSEIRHRHTSL